LIAHSLEYLEIVLTGEPTLLHGWKLKTVQAMPQSCQGMHDSNNMKRCCLDR
jgi:hypothetical protein